MKLLKITLPVIMLFVCIVLYGCADTKLNTPYVIDLCDYKNVQIAEEVYDVPIEDLNASMTLYANAIDEKYEDYTYLTDEIVKENYDCETVSDFQSYVLKEIITHRISDSIMEKILTTSRVSVKDETEFNDYYKKSIEAIEHEAKEQNCAIDSFIEQNYGMSMSELREDEYTYFVSIIILREILNKEDAAITQEDIDNERSEIAQEMDCSIEDTYQHVLDEDILYTLAENKMYDLIAQWYQSNIDDALSSMKAKLNIT